MTQKEIIILEKGDNQCMDKKKIPLPKFKSIDEMAHFFDNVSLLDLESEEVDINFVKVKDTHPDRRVRRQKRSVHQR